MAKHVYRCEQPFAVFRDGRPFVYSAGEVYILDENDPDLADGRAGWFTDIGVASDADEGETATKTRKTRRKA